MLYSFLKAFSFQLKVSRVFRATPYDLNVKSCKLEPLSDRKEIRRYLCACYFSLCYATLAVLVQGILIPKATESYILSLVFTLVTVAPTVPKLMTLRSSKESTQLFNSLILHETREFGKSFNFATSSIFLHP
jgi:hypothetical protein